MERGGSPIRERRRERGSPRGVVSRAGLWLPVLVQPAQHRADATRGEGDAGVGRGVVEVHRIAVGSDGEPAGEDTLFTSPKRS